MAVLVEGWAYYVENISYGYASDVLLANGASNITPSAG